MTASVKSISRLQWVYISGAAFILFMIFSGVLIAFASRLSAYGITSSVFYLLLIPAGLCAAGFLFGALRSHAKYSGKVSYGQLELSGPVVVFCLVILGGIFLAKPASSFLLTVRVHGTGSKADLIREGRVIADFGSQRVEKKIDQNGEVLFAGVSPEFIGKEINLFAEIDGYVPSGNGTYTIPDEKIIFLEVHRKTAAFSLRGKVVDLNRNPLKNVFIDFESGSASALSNENGNFTTVIAAEPGALMLVTASLNGKTGYYDYIRIPENGTIVIPFDTLK
jgi:hypothetical protein